MLLRNSSTDSTVDLTNLSVQERSMVCDDDSSALHDDSKWYLPRASREDAEQLLQHKADGTFLIRPSRVSGQHALSIV